MKNALILHGAANNPSGNWFPWLKKEFEKKGYKVWVPELPNADRPILKDWLKTVKDWELNQNSIMIGHSAGGTLILRLLEALPRNVKIDKTILVAGFIDKGSIKEYWPYKEDITKGGFDWKKIKSAANEFILIYSDNDPYDCGIRHGEAIKEKVGGKLILKKGQGHFNLEMGEKYKEFSELLMFI